MPNWENIGKSLAKAAGNGVVTVLTGGAERVSKNQNVSYEQRQAASAFGDSLNRMTDRSRNRYNSYNDYDDYDD